MKLSKLYYAAELLEMRDDHKEMLKRLDGDEKQNHTDVVVGDMSVLTRQHAEPVLDAEHIALVGQVRTLSRAYLLRCIESIERDLKKIGVEFDL